MKIFKLFITKSIFTTKSQNSSPKSALKVMILGRPLACEALADLAQHLISQSEVLDVLGIQHIITELSATFSTLQEQLI